MNTSFLRLFFLSMCFSVFSFLLPAQTPIEKTFNAIYSKKLYTVKDGLSQGYITSLFEDHNGYLWVGTLSGLNRFDGNTFETFSENPNDSFSVKGQYVDQILEDHLKRIWVLFNNGRISIFDEKKRHFHNVILSGYNEHEGLNYLKLVCNQGKFWIRQTNQIGRLTLIDQNEENATWRAKVSYVTVINEEKKKPSLLNSILFDEQNRLWLSSVENVLVIDDPYTRSDTVYAKTFSVPNSTEPIDHFALHQKENDSIWLTTWQGNLFLIKRDRVLHRTQHKPPNKHLGIFSLEKDVNSIIWLQGIGTMALYNPKSSLFHETNLNSTFLYQSKDGTIWSGTDGFGLYCFAPRNSPFLNIGKNGYGIESRQEMYSGALIMGRNEDVLMMKDGVLRLDKETGLWVNHVPWMEEWAQGKEINYVKAYLEDSQGRNWLASNRTVFCKEKGGKISIYKDVEKGSSSIKSAIGPRGIIEDKEHKVWLISSGLVQTFDEESQDFIKYPYQIEKPPPREFYFNSFIDYADKLWLATEMGLYLFDKNTKEIERKWIEVNNTKLEDVAFSTLHVDLKDTNKIWVGTKNKGLFVYDQQQKSWTALSQKNGLTNNTIYAIAQDSLSRIWLSTNAGIFCFDPKEQTWLNYREEHGIQGDEFNSRAFVQLSNGQLFFGGVNGVTSFQPLNLQRQMQKLDYPMVLTSFAYEKQMDDSTQLHYVEDLKSTPKLAFTDSRRLEIEFAWLHYNQPENHHYAYRLSENESWIDLENQNKLSFYNLSAGQYKIEIQSTDWLGNTNQSTLLVPFTILAPWYRSGWAYAFYILFSLALLSLIFRVRENRKRLEVEAVFSRKEADRFKELEQTKSRFFVNITHELKTPLTLIIGPLEQVYQQAKTNAEKKLINTVRRNAADLFNLINQLLDLGKIEQGKMQVKYSTGDLALFVSEICSKSKHLADSKNIELTFKAIPEVIDTSFDSSKIERIIINLLSNALKFSPENTHVQVKLEQFKDSVLLQVKDEGSGIPSEKLESIFDPFYQIDSSEKRKYGGTGIGLSIVKEYSDLLGASVSVKNNLGVGCTFQIEFPVMHVDQESNVDYDIDVSGLSLAPETKAIKDYAEGTEVILIAEDNRDLNDYLKNCLINYFVIQAYNGKEAWQLVQEHLPDLILSDNMMPEMTGVELCSKVKDSELSSHIPVIILTAKSAIESRVEGLSAGADDYLSKPFNQTELLLRIRNLIGLRKALREKYEWGLHSAKRPESDATLSAKDMAFLQKAEAIIEANLDNEGFEVSDFHEALHLSRSQAHRKIKALTNVSISIFIRSYRLKRAMEMMQAQRLIVKEAAYRVGFSSPNYFSKCFHEQFGFPPNQLVN